MAVCSECEKEYGIIIMLVSAYLRSVEEEEEQSVLAGGGGVYGDR